MGCGSDTRREVKEYRISLSLNLCIAYLSFTVLHNQLIMLFMVLLGLSLTIF